MAVEEMLEEKEMLSGRARPKFTGMLIYATLLVSFGAAFPFAYPGNVVNPSVGAFREYLNETSFQDTGKPMTESHFSVLWSGIVNAMFAGALLGALIVPFLADKLGRKPTMIIALVPFGLGAIIQIVGIYYVKQEALGVGRFIGGITTGMMSSIASVYLTESAPTPLRGIVGACQALMIQWLTVLSMVLGLPNVLGVYDRLTYLVGIQLIPAVILFVGTFFLPESPKFLLLAKNDVEGAKRSIKIMHGADAPMNEIINTIREEAGDEKLNIFNAELWNRLFHHYKWNVAIGAVALAAMMFSGIPAIFAFSTLLFEKVGIEHQYAPYVSLGMIALNAIVTTITTFIIEKTGRRPLLMTSLFGVVASGLFYMVFAEIYVYQGGLWATILASMGLWSLLAFIGIGVGPIPWFLTNELIPFAYRSAAQMVGISALYVVAVVSTFAFLPIFMEIQAFAFLIVYTFTTALCTIFLYKYMPETKGREVQDIAEEIVMNHSKFRNQISSLRKEKQ